MSRPPREFRAESFELEGRLLLTIARGPLPLAIGRGSLPSMGQAVGFEGTTIPRTSKASQVALQQDGEATVQLYRTPPFRSGTLQVVVATDPSSPAVGVNVGAVNQTVTFADGQLRSAVRVPILAGAPNPGEVDVNLTITPVNPPPNFTSSGPMELRVLASDASIPPRIVSSKGTPQGIVLTFSKPMDPAGASNLSNYAVRSTSTKTTTSGGLIGWVLFGYHTSRSSASVPLQSAQYDPATHTVTLVPKRKLTYGAMITVTQGHQTKVSGRPGHQLNVAQGLTDVEGHPINDDTTPGKFRLVVGLGNF